MSDLFPVYCPKCKRPVDAADQFCRGCGHDQSKPSQPATPPPAPLVKTVPPVDYLHPTYSQPPPPQGSQQPIVNVQVNNAPQKPSNAGWWAAALVLVFGTPLGCVAVPVVLVLLALVVAAFGGAALSFLTVLAFCFPVLIAFGASWALWKVPAQMLTLEQKRIAIAAVMALGLLANLIWLATHQGAKSSTAPLSVSAGITKPIINILPLMGKSQAEVDNALGYPYSISTPGPGDTDDHSFRCYKLSGTESTQFCFDKDGALINALIYLPESKSTPADVLVLGGIDVGDRPADIYAPAGRWWTGNVGGFTLNRVGVVDSNSTGKSWDVLQVELRTH